MEMVRFFDVTTGQVSTIPAAELAPGAVEAQVEGIDGVVWILLDQLQPSPIRHPPFPEEIRAFIRHIQAAFAEHLPMSFEEWEEGFRRDLHPEQEMALWYHAARVYDDLVGNGEWSAAERKDAYDVIAACMNSPPDKIRHVIAPAVLSRERVEAIVGLYYNPPQLED